MIRDLEAATGAHFSEFALAESNKIYNEHNAVMREFAEIAADAEITAAQRSDVFKSAWFMLPEEHTAIVKQINEELKKGPKAEGKVRVLVSGILADSPSLLLQIFDRTASRLYLMMWLMSPDSTVPMFRIWLIRLMRWLHKFADMDNCTLLYDKDKKRVDYIIEQAKEA